MKYLRKIEASHAVSLSSITHHVFIVAENSLPSRVDKKYILCYHGQRTLKILVQNPTSQERGFP